MTVMPVEPNLGFHKRNPENRHETSGLIEAKKIEVQFRSVCSVVSDPL